MINEWFPTIELPMTLSQFQQLPRNSAYRYEHLKDSAWLTPQPKFFHAHLDFAEHQPATASLHPQRELRQLEEKDWEKLLPLFVETFAQMQPFASLSADQQRIASDHLLEQTRTGGDGPPIESASYVITEKADPIGAILLTLLPKTESSQSVSLWKEAPPTDVIEKGHGRPHLTWIFVSRNAAREGIGTILLGKAVDELRSLGYRELLSTFLLGNDASVLWHWRNGFRLLQC